MHGCTGYSLPPKPGALYKFQWAVKWIMKYRWFISGLSVYSRDVIELMLRCIRMYLNSSNADLFLKMGLCEQLIPLLTLQSAKNRTITDGSLRGLVLLSVHSDFYYCIKQNSETLLLMEAFLRGRYSEQRMMACVICNVFRQLPAHQTKVLRDASMVQLLMMCLTSKFATIVIAAMEVLDELTYHSENAILLLKNDALLSSIEDYVQSEIPQIQTAALHILLNVLSFIDNSSTIRGAVLRRSFRLEFLMKQIYNNEDSLGYILQLDTARDGSIMMGRPTVGRSRTTNIRRKSSLFGQRASTRMLNMLTIDDTPNGIRNAHSVGYVTMSQNTKDLILAHRKQVIFEILWLFCGLHGKVKGFSRSESVRVRDSDEGDGGDVIECKYKGIEIHPEDRYFILAEELDRDAPVQM